MPDIWFEALIVAGLAILLWQPRPGWRRVVAAGVVLGTSATVAQVGEALLLPAVIYLLVAGGGWRRALGKAAALCAAFALPILAYCTVSYLLSGAFFLSHTGVTSFYGRTAAAADCATLRLPPPSAGMCPTPAQQAHGPDWLEYATGSPVAAVLPEPAAGRGRQPDLRLQPPGADPAAAAAARAPTGATWSKLFALTRDDQPGRHAHLPLAVPDRRTRTTRRTTTEAIVTATVSRFGGGEPAVWRPVATFLRAYQLDGGYTPGPAAGRCACWPGWQARWPCCAAGAIPATRQPRLACLLLLPVRAWPCCWSPTCSSSPGGTSCPRWSRWCRPARSGSAC